MVKIVNIYIIRFSAFRNLYARGNYNIAIYSNQFSPSLLHINNLSSYKQISRDFAA